MWQTGYISPDKARQSASLNLLGGAHLSGAPRARSCPMPERTASDSKLYNQELVVAVRHVPMLKARLFPVHGLR